MPLFEYSCRACGRQFEYLTRDGQEPTCPACESDDLQKLLSVFAVGPNGGAKAAAAPGACGTCGDPRGAGSCSMN
jgi:putative FmdB family regulatory protein